MWYARCGVRLTSIWIMCVIRQPSLYAHSRLVIIYPQHCTAVLMSSNTVVYSRVVLFNVLITRKWYLRYLPHVIALNHLSSLRRCIIYICMTCDYREMQTQLASQASILKEQEDELSTLNQEHATVNQEHATVRQAVSPTHLIFYLNSHLSNHIWLNCIRCTF